MAWNQRGNQRRPGGPRGRDQAALDEMLRRWQRRVQQLWRPDHGAGTAAAALAALAIVVWLASGFYQISPSDRGVIERFGRYVSLVQPGRGWHWPWPIETLARVDVSSIRRQDGQSLLLTSDESLANVSWAVQYQVSDPLRYLFGLRDPQATLRETADTAIREVVGATPVAELVAGSARDRITNEMRTRIQTLLDRYGSGMRLTDVSFTDVEMPDAVQAAERDAQQAEGKRQQAEAAAQTYANDIVAKARIEAKQQITAAQVYAVQSVATAQGKAQRFDALAAAYAKAPQVTRTRLYIDTVEAILARSHKIVLDTKRGSGNLIYLPLDKLVQSLRSAEPAAGSSKASSGASAAGGAAGSAPAGGKPARAPATAKPAGSPGSGAAAAAGGSSPGSTDTGTAGTSAGASASQASSRTRDMSRARPQRTQ